MLNPKLHLPFCIKCRQCFVEFSIKYNTKILDSAALGQCLAKELNSVQLIRLRPIMPGKQYQFCFHRLTLEFPLNTPFLDSKKNALHDVTTELTEKFMLVVQILDRWLRNFYLPISNIMEWLRNVLLIFLYLPSELGELARYHVVLFSVLPSFHAHSVFRCKYLENGLS